MDKRKVIDAYRRGLLTLQECSQVLGIEKAQLAGILELSGSDKRRELLDEQQHASGHP